jgi:L-2-hydroxyglutarate oxidase LhgO
MENGNTRFDSADEITRGPPKLSDGEIQIAFVKAETDVDFHGVTMQARERSLGVRAHRLA